MQLQLYVPKSVIQKQTNICLQKYIRDLTYSLKIL